jgi:hypothetical protein
MKGIVFVRKEPIVASFKVWCFQLAILRRWGGTQHLRLKTKLKPTAISQRLSVSAGNSGAVEWIWQSSRVKTGWSI